MHGTQRPLDWPKLVLLALVSVAVAGVLSFGLPRRLATLDLFYDRDCGDFATQREAQAFFEAAGPGDPHRLDADHDGVPAKRFRETPGMSASDYFAELYVAGRFADAANTKATR